MSARIDIFDVERDGTVPALVAALDRIPAAQLRRIAIFAKVDGDYSESNRSRDELRARIRGLLAERRLVDHAQVLLAVGCEGVATPFGYLVTEVDDGATPSGEPRLAFGIGESEPVGGNFRDALALVDLAAGAVADAVDDARLATDQVGMVFIKAPAPRGVAMPDGTITGRWARAVAALGVAVALGEVDRDMLKPESIARDLSLYTRHGMTYSGPELDRFEVVAMGNRPGAGGDLAVCSTMTTDLIDARSMRVMLKNAGVALDEVGEVADASRVTAFFLKSGVPDDGLVRGARTIVFGSPITPEKHIRAASSGVLGALLGTTRFFISGDPIQQAPEGGGVAAAIVRLG